MLHKSLFFLLCRPWGNVEELEWREIKSVLLDDNFFRAWVVATQVKFFSPHSDADGSVEVLCLMYVLNPSQGVDIVRRPM